MMERHIVLVGDSIFDNDTYVLGQPGVIEQMRRALPQGWSAFKVAVDGACIRHVSEELDHVPSHATDLIISIGGNDARQYRYLIDRIKSPSDIPEHLKEPLANFRTEYSDMLDLVSMLGGNLHVCTIYTAIPFSEPLWRLHAPAAIGAFNEVIVDEADRRNIPVIRLEEVCTEPDDFAAVSPIEPSVQGGQKIVDKILGILAA